MPRWLIPTTYLLASLFAALVIPRLEYELYPAFGREISVSTAQALLGAVASGMMAFTAIVFSIGMLFIQYTATAFSKRFILQLNRRGAYLPRVRRLRRDLHLRARDARLRESGGIGLDPFFSVIVVAILLVGSTAMLAMLVNQVAELRITRILASVADRGRAMIELMPDEIAAGVARSRTAGTSAASTYSGELMVLVAIDTARLGRTRAGSRGDDPTRIRRRRYAISEERRRAGLRRARTHRRGRGPRRVRFARRTSTTATCASRCGS